MMRKCINYPGYLVTNNGNVYSTLRGSLYKLKLQSFDKKYQNVSITKNGRKRPVRVHRLVATAYIPNPRNCTDVNHIDSNKLNNNVWNLEWCTRSENHLHAYRTGERVSPFKKKAVVAINPESGAMHYFDGIKDASRIMGADRGNISKACKGVLKHCKGYLWGFDNVLRDRGEL